MTTKILSWCVFCGKRLGADKLKERGLCGACSEFYQAVAAARLRENAYDSIDQDTQTINHLTARLENEALVIEDTYTVNSGGHYKTSKTRRIEIERLSNNEYKITDKKETYANTIIKVVDENGLQYYLAHKVGLHHRAIDKAKRLQKAPKMQS
jgi:hypothetical protein